MVETPGGWSGVIERTVSVGMAFEVVVIPILASTDLLRASSVDSQRVRAGLLALLVGWLLCVVALKVIRVRALPWFILGFMGVGVALLREYDLNLLVPALSLAGVILAGRLIDKSQLLIAAAIWLLSYACGLWPEESLRTALSELGIAALIPATFVVLVGGARAVAADLDRSESASVSTTERYSSERLADDADLAARSMVHDHVLHALNVIAWHRNVIPASAPSAAAALALSARHQLNVQPSSETNVRVLIEDLAPMALPTVLIVGAAPPLPPDVAQALAEATAEALRNVGQHAGVSEASVHIAHSSGETAVRVADQGEGFMPSQVGGSSWGIPGSIRLRMATIGGTATIDSRPGRGTVVSLRWQDPSPQTRPGLWGVFPARVEDRLRRVLIQAMAVLVANMLIQAVANAPTLPRPALALAATGLASLAYVWAARLLLRYRLNRQASLVLFAVAVAALWGNILAAFGASVPGEGLWMPGGVTAVLALPVFFRPTHEAVLFVAGVTVVNVCALLSYLGWGQSPADYLGVLLSPPFGLGLLLVARLGLHRIGRRFLKSREVAIRAASTRERQRQTASALRRVLDEEFERTERFLEDVAQGRLQLEEPAVQAEATTMERAIRDQLALWSWPHLRQAQTRARNHWNSTVRVHAHAPSEAADRAQAMLDELTILGAGVTAEGPVSAQPLSDLTMTVRPAVVGQEPREVDRWLVRVVLAAVPADLLQRIGESDHFTQCDLLYLEDVLVAEQVIRTGDGG